MFLFSCDSRTQFEKSVLNEFPGSSREREAALYLLDHLPAHNTLNGEASERFRNAVLAYAGPYTNQDPVPIDSIWRTVSAAAPTLQIIPHTKWVNPAFLTDHIRTVFAQWDRCAWKDSIDFDVFYEYILPYSVKDESPTLWRTVLHDKYYPLIEGIDSPKEAFDTIYNRIYAGFKQEDNPFVFTAYFMPDPLLTDRLMRGTCDMRTSYVVAVARSLCIPVAYDLVKSFANFSVRGHSWPVYVGTNGRKAYVFSIYDTVSHDRGIIDATLFRLKTSFDDGPTAYKIDSLKKIAKVFRYTFAVDPLASSRAESLMADVSSYYGFDDRIELVADRKINGRVYLCTFLTGEGWVPISSQMIRRSNKICFEAVGRDVTYLLAEFDGEELVPIANPVTMHRDGSLYRWDLDPSTTETVILRRKYMLRTTWADRAWEVIGTTFEASDTKDFREHTVLHTIQSPPLEIVNTAIDEPRPARYIRTKVPPGTRNELAEVMFFGRDETGEEIELRGEPIYKNYTAEEAAKATDKVYLTAPYTRTPDGWIGYDFGPGEAPAVTRIEYCPWNDGNLIERGDRYELLYYDMGWHSLGQRTTDGLTLVYDSVPKGAVLWLRDLTKGVEERIFTYQDGKQVWW